MEAPSSSSEEGDPVSPTSHKAGDAGPCCCPAAAPAAPIAASDANDENDDNGNDDTASWSYRLVRGSLYVTGPRVDGMAQAGRAALAAAPGLDPGLLQRAASDRELRDGQHFHITLLHRSEIRDDTSNSSSNKEPPSLLEASRFASSFGDSDTAPRPAPPPPTDRDISSRRGDGWAALYRARGGAFLGSALLPTKKEERGSGGRWLLRWAAMLLPSLPWPGAAASPSPANAAAEGETEELVGSYRQSALARMLQEEEEEGEGKLLTDPLPLYVYRTSGEGRSLAVALLFLPGEYMRFTRGQVYRPLHTTVGFLGQDERDLDARRLGSVQVLAFLQPPETIRRVLFALCRLLRRMRARVRNTCHRGGKGCDSEGEESAMLQGFMPRVLELAREVRTVLGIMGVVVVEEEGEEEMGLLQEVEGEGPLRPAEDGACVHSGSTA